MVDLVLIALFTSFGVLRMIVSNMGLQIFYFGHGDSTEIALNQIFFTMINVIVILLDQYFSMAASTSPDFETALLKMNPYFRVFEDFFTAILVIGAFDDYRLKDRSHNRRDLAANKPAFAFGTERIMRLD